MEQQLIKTRDIEFRNKDERGELIQLISKGFNQINVLKSIKGVKRGEHYHKENEEAFYVLSGTVIVEAKKDGVKDRREFREGDFFVIPKFVMHSFYYPEDNICIQLYDKGIILENGGKDIHNE